MLEHVVTLVVCIEVKLADLTAGEWLLVSAQSESFPLTKRLSFQMGRGGASNPAYCILTVL